MASIHTWLGVFTESAPKDYFDETKPTQRA